MRRGDPAPGSPGARVVLVTSPRADSLRGDAHPAAVLQAAGLLVGKQVRVASLDGARPRGRLWQRQGYVAAVAAGGDGTVGAVATQVAGTTLPLGILPYGTSNDVARSLGIPLDVPAASRTIAGGRCQAVDLGEAVSLHAAPAAPLVARLWRTLHHRVPLRVLRRHRVAALQGAYFLHALTLGLNVEFARLATDAVQREQWGWLTYPTALLAALRHYQPVSVTIRLEGLRLPAGAPAESTSDAAGIVLTGGNGSCTVACQALQVVVANTPVIGGRAHLRLPGVDAQDRLLDVLVIEALAVPWLQALIEGMLRGGHGGGADAAEASLADAGMPPAPERAAPRADAPGTGHALPRGQPPASSARLSSAPLAGPASNGLGDLWHLPGLHHYQAQTVRLDAPVPVAVTVDGEVGPRTPVEVRLAAAQVRVLLPAPAL